MTNKLPYNAVSSLIWKIYIYTSASSGVTKKIFPWKEGQKDYRYQYNAIIIIYLVLQLDISVK